MQFKHVFLLLQTVIAILLCELFNTKSKMFVTN